MSPLHATCPCVTVMRSRGFFLWNSYTASNTVSDAIVQQERGAQTNAYRFLDEFDAQPRFALGSIAPVAAICYPDTARLGVPTAVLEECASAHTRCARNELALALV
jgi:hypothetical protein